MTTTATMRTTSETSADGVTRRRIDLEVEGQTVPGLLWQPDGTGAGERRPTILMGHGGFQSKEAPNLVAMAERFAREHGWRSITLDAPGHGERRTEEQIRQQEETLRRLRERGVDDEMRRGRERVVGEGGRPDRGEGDDADGPRLPRMAREWRALLDLLDADPATAGGPYGYWGVSMGCRYGIPLLANEPRITAGVLGLFGLLPDPAFRATVESITQPLLFLFQYHDELMTPEAGLALFEAFGSAEKTMHINPGRHVEIPVFERDASAAFFARHLT